MHTSHPVSLMVLNANKLNAGIIAGGFKILLTPKTGDADINTAINSLGIGKANVERYNLNFPLKQVLMKHLISS